MEHDNNKEEVIVEEEQEVVEETYLVELDDTQKKLLTDSFLTETLAKYEADGNTYTIKLEDKEQILTELDGMFESELLNIVDTMDIDEIYNDKTYGLFRVYFSNADDCNLFTMYFLKYCFEMGKIYNKFNGNDVPIIAIYYVNNVEVKSYASFMLDEIG